ncbi:hemolysin family protein [Liquorilactobacillus vini]|uniref:hemolysin family protein n=1 Tax=Liquorilactobacillus vini TaxID=238015 RepID=UPI0002DA8FCB|nr:hemolysin family protein [Liquorilactobacillus vini]
MNPDPASAVLVLLSLCLLTNAAICSGMTVAVNLLDRPVSLLKKAQLDQVNFTERSTDLRIIATWDFTVGLIILEIIFSNHVFWQNNWWWFLPLVGFLLAMLNEIIQQLVKNDPQKFLAYCGKWTKLSLKFSGPIIWLTKKISKIFLRKSLKSIPEEGQNKTSAVFLKEIIDQQGKFNEGTFQMLKGVVSLQQKIVREVMVARTDAFMIDIKNDNDRNIDAIVQLPYSRVPVFSESKDNIVGIVHIKNLLYAAREEGFEHIKIRRVMQPALFIPETLPVDKALIKLKKTRNQMAILFDEYGGVVGLVTLEDLIEEIVGEISDESDQPQPKYQQISNYEFLVEGRLPLDEFNAKFKTNLQKDDIDTIAGYLIACYGEIPADDSHVEVKMTNMKLVTEQVSEGRILKIRVILPPKNKLNLK